MDKKAIQIRYLTILLTVVCLVLSRPGRASPIEQLPTIAALPIIRLVIDNSPGAGHQAASAMVYQRLRELGYQGQVEVLYAAATKERLGFLFPFFNSEGADDQNLPDLKLRFVSMDYFQAAPERFTSVPLALAGASDHPHTSPAHYRAAMLLMVQPWKWVYPPSLTIEAADVPRRTQILDSIKNRPLIQNLPSLEVRESFWSGQTGFNLDLSAKLPALRAMAEAVPRAELAPAYGHFMESGQALLYAVGFLAAHQREPTLFDRGMVMPVFNYLDSYEQVRVAQKLEKSPHLRGRVDVLSVSNPAWIERLKNLGPGQVLIVQVGPAPKAIYEYLHLMATLPPVVEGRNSMNLMHLIGKAYLPSNVAENYLLSLRLPQVAALAVDALTPDSYDFLPPALDSRRAQHLADFFIESRRPESKLNRFF
ncbi:MAG: hypothetical protein AB7N80_07115 [Bdellovibrionales bacterium]